MEDDSGSQNVSNSNGNTTRNATYSPSLFLIPFCIGLALLLVFIGMKIAMKSLKEKKNQKGPDDFLVKSPTIKVASASTAGERCSDLVFFVEECNKFKVEDLLASKAELQGQNPCASLYKVSLKNKTIFAVKRVKNLKVSFEEFGRTMRLIGNLKHPNILPLVAYRSLDEEKLLIYKYQRNGSLLTLLQNYAEGKRSFPWGHRLAISNGIAKGLGFMHSCTEGILHGNLKPSNILLSENEEPLISEFGYQRYLNPKSVCLFSSNGYTAPEKRISEQADVYSFGIILLVLLTGKPVERSGIDLPKWVKSMVREEWTGEVFDREVNVEGRQWAFPLLNVALKCVSLSPDLRPNILDVIEKIEEVVNAHREDHSISTCSIESDQRDGSLLHTVIPEYWDSSTPGSHHADGNV